MAEPIYAGCTCTENHLRFEFCACGARQASFEHRAKGIIPSLTESEVDAMIELKSAIPLRTINRVGRYNFKRAGLLTGINRSGDNAEVLSDLGKVVQMMLQTVAD